MEKTPTPKRGRTRSINLIEKSDKFHITDSLKDQPLEVQMAVVNVIKDACKRVGMSVDDYLMAIKNGLNAGKKVEKTIDGCIVVEEEPDHAMRLKAAAMGLEVEGYLKAKGEVSTVNNFFDVKALVQEFKNIR